MRETILFYLLLSVVYPLSLLPFRVLFLISDFLYVLVYYVIGYRKKVTYLNLKNAFPEKTDKEIERITKRFYRYFCDLLVENVKLLTISKYEAFRRWKFKNLEMLGELYDHKKSVLAVIGHYGNWEFGGLALALNTPYQLLAIYKPFSSKRFDDLMKNLRAKYGTVMVPMDNVIRTLLAKKDELTLTLFIADQTPSDTRTCHWTTFLNQDTPVFLGTEKIARKTNYPVIFFHTRKVKRGYYEVEIIPIAEEPALTRETEITEKHTRVLEGIIKENPEYWLWTHRRWKHKRVSSLA